MERTTRQGVPTATVIGGMLRLTTLPTPTTDPYPMRTPGRITALLPEPDRRPEPLQVAVQAQRLAHRDAVVLAAVHDQYWRGHLRHLEVGRVVTTPSGRRHWALGQPGTNHGSSPGEVENGSMQGSRVIREVVGVRLALRAAVTTVRGLLPGEGRAAGRKRGDGKPGSGPIRRAFGG
jgi:hypothetical protein